MGLDYTVRPISDRTAFRGVAHRAQFTASWSSTLSLLERELAALNAKRVVFELDVRENQIRVDGQLYANATASSTAVRIAFDSKHGPLVYATDRFGYDGWKRPLAQGWRENVRAIALGLEALRKVDRYGISRSGEQYRGYKAITGVTNGGMSSADAVAVLRRWAGTNAPDDTAALARAARIGAHPDRHGNDHSASDEVLKAMAALGMSA
jgi:hypothetical protein